MAGNNAGEVGEGQIIWYPSVPPPCPSTITITLRDYNDLCLHSPSYQIIKYMKSPAYHFYFYLYLNIWKGALHRLGAKEMLSFNPLTQFPCSHNLSQQITKTSRALASWSVITKKVNCQVEGQDVNLSFQWLTPFGFGEIQTNGLIMAESLEFEFGVYF